MPKICPAWAAQMELSATRISLGRKAPSFCGRNSMNARLPHSAIPLVPREIPKVRCTRVQRTFGISRGTRGIAECGSRAFIELRPQKLGALRPNEILVADNSICAAHAGHIFGIAQANPILHPRAMRRDALDQGRQGWIEQQSAIVRVIDDVDQLWGMQARIAGVHDHAAARYREIGFQMPMIVQGDRPYRSP